jgi:hypothetical protein
VDESSAPHAHPSTEDHDRQDERPHACIDGWVFVGHMVEGEDGEEVEVLEAVVCRYCNR